jgi:hypothetical protein
VEAVVSVYKQVIASDPGSKWCKHCMLQVAVSIGLRQSGSL